MISFQKLPDGELEIMQAVWECDPPISRKKLEQILFHSHPMAVTTLLTFLTRLTEKGFLRVKKNGRHNVYIPLISKEDYISEHGQYFLRYLCKGNLSLFASALCDGSLSKEEIRELRELLEERLE